MTNTGSPLPPSLPEYIRRLVEVDIVTGALAARTRITEEQLAKRYSVSRTPVREAMRLLENQRLLVRRKAGVFVATHTTRDEVEVIYQVRQSVESFLTEQAAGAISARHWHGCKRCMTSSGVNCTENDPRPISPTWSPSTHSSTGGSTRPPEVN